MNDIMVKIAVALVTKLLTDAFLGKVIVHTLRAIADKSGKQFPETLVDDLASAWGVSEPGRQKTPPAA